MEKRAIILFDLDGTLIDSTRAIYESFCEAFESFGREAPSEAAVRAGIGHTLEDMFEALGVGREERGAYVAKYREVYRGKMERGTTLLPMAQEAIVKASEFATLGVVTTKRGDYSQILLASLGVGEYFSVVVGIEMVSKPKPDREPIVCALEALRGRVDSEKLVREGRVYMVGDTTLDLEAARAAGVRGVGVLCGFGKRAELEACLRAKGCDEGGAKGSGAGQLRGNALCENALYENALYENAWGAVEAIAAELGR